MVQSEVESQSGAAMQVRDSIWYTLNYWRQYVQRSAAIDTPCICAMMHGESQGND